MAAAPSDFPLIRDTQALSRRRFDLLVVGGGIYGAWTACDAAQRGLSVALIEKNDWASGTSSASSKLIHGGLRYLEHYDFGLVRHALAERRVLTRIAPHLVRPLRFVVPVFRNARAGLLKLGAGLTLYDWLAGADQPVDRHRRHSAARLGSRYPYLELQGLRGGFSYGDCQEDDARMTLAVVAAAQAAGAVVANRIEALALRNGAEVHDLVDGSQFHISADATVAATGPWTAQLLGKTAPRIKLVKGVHLVLPAIEGCSEAFLLTAPQDGRVFFVIPWYGRTLVGTTESRVQHPSEAVATQADIDYLLEAVDAQIPGLGWSRDDVLSHFAGVRSLQDDAGENLSATTREFAIAQPRPDLLLPIGGKYTTARCDACTIVDRVQGTLSHKLIRSRTASTPLPGTPAGTFKRWLETARQSPALQALPTAAGEMLLMRHGTGIKRLEALIRKDASLAQPLQADLPFIAAEAELAIRDEMALSVDDVLRRRLPLQLLMPNGPERQAIEAGIANRLAH